MKSSEFHTQAAVLEASPNLPSTPGEASVAAQVKVRHDYNLPQLRGRVGLITKSHDLPDHYASLEVRFENGTSWLFRHHELEEAENDSYLPLWQRFFSRY